jgi:hypothetical protein
MSIDLEGGLLTGFVSRVVYCHLVEQKQQQTI